jgi:hypothetical protein
MSINVKVDTSALAAMQARRRGLSDSKIKTAIASALNSAAYVGAQATKAEMASVFDRPTPWVMGSVRYAKASLDKLSATIDFDRWGNKTGVSVDQVLNAEIFGGNRHLKRFEKALNRMGILPAGMFCVPTIAAQIDPYGNLKGSQIVQILAWFNAMGEQGYKANMTDRTRTRLGKDKRNGQRGFAYFALVKPHGKLKAGIYQRFTLAHGSSIKPIILFVHSPSYRRRLDFYGVGEREALKEFKHAFGQYLDQMLQERGL